MIQHTSTLQIKSEGLKSLINIATNEPKSRVLIVNSLKSSSFFDSPTLTVFVFTLNIFLFFIGSLY